MARPWGAVLLIAAALATAACSTDAGGADPTTSPSAPDEPTTSASEGVTEDPPPATAELGEPLDPAEVAPRGPGVAWQVDGAVLLTTTSGTTLGHLPGWTLDRDRSDRLAAAVLVDGDGAAHVATAGGLVTIDDPLPLADRHQLRIEDGSAIVLEPDDTPVSTLDLADPDALWVSATGAVVGVVDGTHLDVAAGTPVDVPAGCRTADRHTPEDPLFVCDDGARLAGGIDLPAPEGSRFGWVTVGTSGDEVLATIRTADALGLVVASRSTGEHEVRGLPEPESGTAGLFFRSSGDAWIASHLGGRTTTLQVLTPDGATADVREVPGATDAVIWTR